MRGQPPSYDQPIMRFRILTKFLKTAPPTFSQNQTLDLKSRLRSSKTSEKKSAFFLGQRLTMTGTPLKQNKKVTF